MSLLSSGSRSVLMRIRLLHDVGDHKYSQPGENPENQIAEFLLEQGADAGLAMKGTLEHFTEKLERLETMMKVSG